MKRDFNQWLTMLKDTIASWGYYADFSKVYKNVDDIKIELNILNSLIGSKNIENEFKQLVNEYPKVLGAIPILIAKRKSDKIMITETEGHFAFDFNKPNYSIDEYCMFMRKTGIFDLLENHIIKDLTDYVKGVEVGMDSNGRKNRTGHAMENLVEGFIIKAGYKKDVNYFKELTKSEIETRFKLDLSSISNDGKSEKRFDFVIKTDSIVYGIETNFYGSSGSKLNETARSYQLLYDQSKDINGFKFVWITDGIGWNSARRNLQQTFDVMDDIYCIKELEEGILSSITK